MRSTKTSDRKKAQAIADGYEAAYQGKKTMAQIWRVLSDAAKQFTGESLKELTMRQYTDRWLGAISNEVDPNSLHAYRSHVRLFLKFMTGQKRDTAPLFEITKTDVVAWRDDAVKSRSRTYVNGVLTTLKTMFAAAKSDELVGENPASEVNKVSKRGNKKEHPRRPFTIAELRKILSHCTAENEEWSSIVMFGLYTGQRLGDIVSLRWRDVDLMSREVRFPSTIKTEGIVTVPMADALRSFVVNLKSCDDPNEVVHPKAFAIFIKNHKVSRLSNQFIEILAEAGLRVVFQKTKLKEGESKKRRASAISFHSLRHTLVSLLKNEGVSPAIVQDIVGHESAAVSQLYTHIDPKAKEAAMRRLPALDLMRELF